MFGIFFSDYEIKDLIFFFLDVAVTGFVIYKILLLVQGTRTVQMLIGIGLITLIYMLSGSEFLPLDTVHWISQKFFDSFIIIFAILFQNDLRRLLSQIGTRSWFVPGEYLESVQAIEEIVKACITLANKKIGALIVIERENGLNQYIEIGTLLDAKVRKELLISIFHPTSPLHDGAVIIQNGRIMAAGSLLPLSLRSNLEERYGTRHRAAIGITEETDAISIVVSEEEGKVAISMNGKITKDLDATLMRKVLNNLFTKQPVKKVKKFSLLDTIQFWKKEDGKKE